MTLFWKIFAWFGAAQLLIAGALYLVAVATQRGFDRGMARSIGNSLEARGRAAAVAYETGGPSALRFAWGAPRPENDLAPQSGRAAGLPSSMPDDGPELRRLTSFVSFAGQQPRVLAGVPLRPPALAAARQAQNSGRGVATDEGISFLARRVETPLGQRYVVVTALRPRLRGFGPLGDLTRPDGNMGVRFGVLALLMVAFCYGLARYISDPARKLSGATHQLASGDLSARVGPQIGRRRDELADLGRDFDVMATRIEELVNSQKRLLSDISHELRSPLARLNVALELAGDDASPTTHEFLTKIKEESAELDALIGGLLTLQRLEARETAVAKTPLDLAELVKRVGNDVAFEAQQGGRRVEIVRLDACCLMGNAELLRSALQNVARNAVLHGAGPTIEIALERDAPNEALIWVRDYGSGVPDEEIARLFEPFYRVATARDRQSGGTGLGLSITRRAIEAHGGSVRAFNAPGGGLRVEFRLPVQP